MCFGIFFTFGFSGLSTIAAGIRRSFCLCFGSRLFHNDLSGYMIGRFFAERLHKIDCFVGIRMVHIKILSAFIFSLMESHFDLFWINLHSRKIRLYIKTASHFYLIILYLNHFFLRQVILYLFQCRIFSLISCRLCFRRINSDRLYNGSHDRHHRKHPRKNPFYFSFHSLHTSLSLFVQSDNCCLMVLSPV